MVKQYASVSICHIITWSENYKPSVESYDEGKNCSYVVTFANRTQRNVRELPRKREKYLKLSFQIRFAEDI